MTHYFYGFRDVQGYPKIETYESSFLIALMCCFNFIKLNSPSLLSVRFVLMATAFIFIIISYLDERNNLSV